MLVGKHLFGWEIRRRHVLAAMLVAIGLTLTLTGTILPDLGLRWGLVKALRGMGMVEVSVSDTDLSLFQGNLVVRKMVARPPQGATLGIKDFTLRFRWAPLLRKRLVIDRVALEGVEIHVTRRPDGKGFIIDGLPLAVTESPTEPVSGSTPWGFDIASLELTDSRLQLTDGDLTTHMAVTKMVVESLHNHDPAQPVTVHLQGSLNGAAIVMTGKVLPFAAEPSFSLEADLRGLDLKTVNSIAAKAGLGGLTGQANISLAVDGIMRSKGMEIGGSAKLDLADASLASPLGITVAALQLDLPKLSWDGQRLDLTAKLDAKTLNGSHPDGSVSVSSLKLDAAKLGWDGKLSWQGALEVVGAKIAIAGIEANPETLAWHGRLDLDPTKGGASLAGRADGRLDLGSLVFKGFDLAISHKRAMAEGWLEFGRDGKLPLAAKLKTSVEALSLRQPSTSMDWLAADRIETGELSLAFDGAITADRITTIGLTALRQEGKGGYPWRVEVKSTHIDHFIQDSDGDMEIGEIRLDGLTARISRTKNGFLGIPSPSPPAKIPVEKSEPPAFALNRLMIGGNSRILYFDTTLAELVRLEARSLEANLTDLDSDHPDHDSGFEIKAGMGAASIALNGVIRPFAETLSGHLDGKIQALELPPLSPYLAEALGVNLNTGQFSGTFKGGAVKGALDGRLEVELANLFIAQPDPNAPVAKKMDMPIETVLDLLRDSEDRIRLTLPVRGNLANPDLDISDAVAQAVAGALKSTMLTTLKLAFPLAALIELAVDAEDKSRLTLAPLSFPPGTASLSDNHHKTLGDIAQLLKARPSLKLTLCGKADSADWPVLAERRRATDKPILSRLERLVGAERKPDELGEPDRAAMARLADSRANAAKQYLVDTIGIEAGRVFGCRSEIEAVTGKGPRVELLL